MTVTAPLVEVDDRFYTERLDCGHLLIWNGRPLLRLARRRRCQLCPGGKYAEIGR